MFSICNKIFTNVKYLFLFIERFFQHFLQYDNNYVKKGDDLSDDNFHIIHKIYFFSKANIRIFFIDLQKNLKFIKYAHVYVASECFSNQILSFFISKISVQSFSRIRPFIRKELKLIKYFWITFKLEIYRFVRNIFIFIYYIFVRKIFILRKKNQMKKAFFHCEYRKQIKIWFLTLEEFRVLKLKF